MQLIAANERSSNQSHSSTSIYWQLSRPHSSEAVRPSPQCHPHASSTDDPTNQYARISAVRVGGLLSLRLLDCCSAATDRRLLRHATDIREMSETLVTRGHLAQEAVAQHKSDQQKWKIGKLCADKVMESITQRSAAVHSHSLSAPSHSPTQSPPQPRHQYRTRRSSVQAISSNESAAGQHGDDVRETGGSSGSERRRMSHARTGKAAAVKGGKGRSGSRRQ